MRTDILQRPDATGDVLERGEQEWEHRPVRILGVRRSALLEIGLFFLVAVLLDRLVFDGDSFWSVSPHPFWLIVLLVTVQYGTAEGVLAALVSTVVLLAGGMPGQTLDQDLYDYLYSIVRHPLMWFVAAVLLGELRMRHARERELLRQELKEAREKERIIAEAYQRQQRIREDLETRVAGQMRTVISMHQAVKSLEQLDSGKVLFSIMDMVRAVMSPRKSSVFILSQDVLEAAVHTGWTGKDEYLRVIGAEHPLFQEVVTRQRILSVANENDEPILDRQGVLAGPLINADTGEVIGMLKIEELDFIELGWTTIKNFEVVCEWIGTVYGNAKRYHFAKENSVVDDRGLFLSSNYYTRQTAFLTSLARRHNFALAQIDISLQNYDELPKDLRSQAPLALSNAVKEVLRSTDLAFDRRNNGREFTIILPATPTRNARIVEERLLAALQNELGGRLKEASWTVRIQDLHTPE